MSVTLGALKRVDRTCPYYCLFDHLLGSSGRKRERARARKTREG